MEAMRRELFPGVWLRTVHTQKFKSAYLSLTLMAPLAAETAAANALIPSVLRRGTEEHPDLESLSAALDQLYGGAVEPVVRKKGETQCVGFAASFLDDAYTLEGEPILEGAAALLGELPDQSGGPHPGPGERQAPVRPLPPHPAHVPGGGLWGGQAGR